LTIEQYTTLPCHSTSIRPVYLLFVSCYREHATCYYHMLVGTKVQPSAVGHRLPTPFCVDPFITASASPFFQVTLQGRHHLRTHMLWSHTAGTALLISFIDTQHTRSHTHVSLSSDMPSLCLSTLIGTHVLFHLPVGTANNSAVFVSVQPQVQHCSFLKTQCYLDKDQDTGHRNMGQLISKIRCITGADAQRFSSPFSSPMRRITRKLIASLDHTATMLAAVDTLLCETHSGFNIHS